MTLEVNRIQEQIAQAERDLEEIKDQVAIGDVDAETAELLSARYAAERDRLQSELDGQPAVGDTPPELAAIVTPRRLAGAAVLVVAAAVLAFGVTQAVGSGEPAVEGVAADVLAAEGVNLDDISNEDMEVVVAENPDIAPMRLALADRYFREGDFGSALTHYMYVLETLNVRDPSALANVGWMSYLSGVPDVGASFVEQSIEAQPDAGIAFWYLANIRFAGLSDPAGAIDPLEKLLAYENLPDDLKAEAESLLAEAKATP